MNIKKILAFVLVLSLAIPFFACGNSTPAQNDIPTIETHADAVDPDTVTAVEVIHYEDNGDVKFQGKLEKGSPYIPLVATVYDKAAQTTSTDANRILKFKVIMTLEKNKTIELDVYSDLTMDMGKVTLTAQDMTQFLYSLIMTATFSTETTGA